MTPHKYSHLGLTVSQDGRGFCMEEGLTPQEKRKATILKRYGSFSNAMKGRDVRDLILGGFNGGSAKTEKGFSKWEEGELSRYAKRRQRDKNGRFLPKDGGQATGAPERPKR